MDNYERVLITVDRNLLTRIDEYISHPERGIKRSTFIRNCCEYYLDIKLGVKNRLRRRELDEKICN